MKILVTIIASLVILLALAACGDTSNSGQQGTNAGTSTAPTATTPAQGTIDASQPVSVAQAVIANSELVLGENRFVLGLLDTKSGQPVNYVPQVGVQFFKVNADNTATKMGDGQVVYHSENLPAGLFVSRMTFNEPGAWGAIVTVQPEGEEAYQQRLNFTVLERGSVPMIGDPAPPSKNQTIHDPDIGGIGEICSAQPPDNMHEMTIADAVKSGKPTVILIAAPGFCPSFTCGPDLEMTQKLQAKYGDKVNFIHIESPNEIQTHTHTGPVDPNHSQQEGHYGVAKPQVQTAKDWGLKSEPWLFIVDKGGKIAERFEGGLTIQEVEPALVKVVQ